jgi:hypothetical protein
LIVCTLLISAAAAFVALSRRDSDERPVQITFHGRHYKASSTPARLTSDERPAGTTSDGGVIYVSTEVDPVAPITVDVTFSDATVTYVLMGGP